MINYRKSVLSVVAALAISSSALYSTYIPLTTDGTVVPALGSAVDGKWTLFGVTAFNSRGVTGGEDGEFSISGGAQTSAVDRVEDNAFEDGMTKGSSLAKVKLLNGSPEFIEVRVDTSDVEFEETDPLRTIYVKDTDNTTGETVDEIIFAFTYRASLEGKKLEYSRNILGTYAKSITINSANTYRYPAVGTLTQASAGDNSNSLINIVDAVDFNLSNNPYTSSFYDKDSFGDTQIGAQRFRMYRFDATNQQWEIYDMNNSTAANDFTQLEIGRGYWGRMQLDTGVDEVGGIVVGKPTTQISHTKYTDLGLEADAWNLLAFDDIYPDIRYSSTGLKLEINASTELTLIDSSTGYEIAVDLGGVDVVADSQLINAAVTDAKDTGAIARVFDLKAFPTGASSTGQEITLISNKRFGVKDSNSSGGINGVTTLFGNKPYDPVTMTREVNPVTELGDANSSNGVYSVYGEHAVIIKPLVGSGTAGEHNVSSISLVSNTGTETLFELNTTIDDVNKTAYYLDIKGSTTYEAFGIDLNYDSNSSDLDPGYILITSASPFYISDKTYVRAFTVREDLTTDTGDEDVEFRITGTPCDVTIVDTDGATIDEANVSAEINLQCLPSSGFSALDSTDSDQSYVVIAGTNRYLDVQEWNATSRLQDATGTYVDRDGNDIDGYDNGLDFAKGAISELYIINKIAALDTRHRFVLDIDTINIDLNDSLSFELNTTGTYTNVGYEDYNITDQAFNLGEYSTYFDLIQQKLTNLFADQNITATITHTAASAADFNASTMTVITDNSVDGIKLTAYEGNPASADANLTDLNSTKTTGIIDIVNAEETLNLKTNTYKSPDYVIDGPLYTMREAGFQLRALVTGTMNYQDDTMAWDNVDLTRKPSEWFDGGDYNLFGIDSTSGYWAYLTDPESEESTIGISDDGDKVKFTTENYHSHWDPYTGVAINHLVANFTVAIDDTIDTYDTNGSITATASIGGAEIDLRQSSTGGRVFTSGINSYDNPDLLGDRQSILLKLSDGLGAKTDGNVDTGLVIDLEKPTKPTISLADGAPKITTTYDENVTYHVIGGAEDALDERSWITNAFVTSSSAPALVAGEGMSLEGFNSLTFCSETASTPVTYKVFVVDRGSNGTGDGTYGTGNASDFDTFTYAALLYDAARIQSIYNTGPETISLGDEYNTSCELSATGISFGLQLTTLTTGETVTFASRDKYASDNAGQPLTIYVINEGVTARLDYQKQYEGSTVYFDIGSEVWSYTLPTETALDALNNTDTNPVVLETAGGSQFIGSSL